MIPFIKRMIARFGPAHAASVKRTEAFKRHRQAAARGDTRLMHETRKALTQATTAKLRMELGR